MAWNALVPLRQRVTIKGQSKLFRWLRADVFYYPFGLGLMISAGCDGRLQPQAVIDVASQIRSATVYQLGLPSGYSRALTLNAVADRVLSQVRGQALGCASSSGQREVEPFTIFTATKGSSDTNDPLPVADSDVHRMLEFVTTWQDPRQRKLHDVASGLVRKPDTSQSITVYGRERGRAVWSPTWFNEQARRSWKLSCYHRNLAFASLQVESLGLFIHETARRPWEGLRERHKVAAKRAADMLGRLYLGDDCYRSWSVRRQITDRGFLSPLANVRQACGLPPLPTS